MTLDGRLKQYWTDLVRSALKHHFKTYTSLEIEKTWKSHHADFAHLKISKGQNRRDIVVKRFIQADEGTSDPLYAALHHPNFLWNHELVSLEKIKRITKKIPGKRALVPFTYGSSAVDWVILSKYIDGPNGKRMLLDAEDDTKRAEVFLKGIKTIARFNGITNAYAADLDTTDRYYSKDRNRSQKASRSLFHDNLIRFIYTLNDELKENIPTFSVEEVAERIRTKKGIDIDERLRAINGLEQSLHQEQKLQHRDCNGLNLIDGILVDLEDFGYSDRTDDISSYSIVVGLGSNSIIRNPNFPYFLQAYLAIEQAYETKDFNCAASLETSTNGAFSKYIRKNMEEHRYYDFVNGFFASAIRKNVQLGASYSRYDENVRRISGASIGATKEELGELFGMIAQCDSFIRGSSQPAQIREYFYELGKLFSELHIADINLYVLDGIRYGTVGGNLTEASPFIRSR